MSVGGSCLPSPVKHSPIGRPYPSPSRRPSLGVTSCDVEVVMRVGSAAGRVPVVGIHDIDLEALSAVVYLDVD